MLLKRYEEEQSILIKEMTQHIMSLRKEIKGVEKLKDNIGMFGMLNSEHSFSSKCYVNVICDIQIYRYTWNEMLSPLTPDPAVCNK